MTNAAELGKFNPDMWQWGTDSTRPRFLHAMLRVKDFDASLRFYTEVLGMKPFSERFDVPVRKVSAIYVGYGGYDVGDGVELVHKWDETGPFSHGSGYTHHISIGVPDMDALVARLDAEGVEWVMRPAALLEGGPRNMFIKDPDGYLVEFIQTRQPADGKQYNPKLWCWGTHDVKMRFLHAMIRVRDFEASLHFYVDLLGMKPFDERFDVLERKVTAIFVGYQGYAAGDGVEIVHKWDEIGPFSHGSGYAHHIAIGVVDVAAEVARLEAAGVKIALRPTILLDGAPPIAFIEDPDGYSIELIQTHRH